MLRGLFFALALALVACVRHGNRFELDPSALGAEEPAAAQSAPPQPVAAKPAPDDEDDDLPVKRRKRPPEPAKDEPLPPLPGEEGAKWLEAVTVQCELGMNGKPCETPPTAATEEQRKECATVCKAAIRKAAEKIVKGTLDECEKKALAQPASAPFPACQFEFPPGADPKGDGTPIPAERLSCVKECKEIVAHARNSAKERERANAQGEQIVTAYKKCMMAVDSTREARKYEAYDRELYDQLMAKTEAKCRAAHKCDWLEQHSDEWQCAYGN